MSEENIIDYSRQAPINRAFALILIVSIIVAAFVYDMMQAAIPNLLQHIFILLPVALLFASLGFGYGSKKAIDYIPGKWERKKTYVSFAQYESMLEEYEDAYGDLYAHPGDCMTFCFLVPILFALGFFSIVFQQQTGPDLISPFFDTLLIVSIYYSIVGVSGFIIGFRIPTIDAEEFFKAPPETDSMEYAQKLDGVPGIRVGMNVELGVRAGAQTILDTELVTGIEGLPDTVKIKIQVSHSGFDYPYIVGTVYKGAPVEEGEEKIRIGTRYKAVLEYSMDDDVAVIVARFHIPKRSSSVPSISTEDFQSLGKLIATRLKENYDSAQ